MSKAYPIGTERQFGGKPYVKTATGWLPKAKGRGNGNADEASPKPDKPDEPKPSPHRQIEELHGVDPDVAINEHAEKIAELSGIPLKEFNKLHPGTKKELLLAAVKKHEESKGGGDKPEKAEEQKKDAAENMTPKAFFQQYEYELHEHFTQWAEETLSTEEAAELYNYHCVKDEDDQIEPEDADGTIYETLANGIAARFKTFKRAIEDSDFEGWDWKDAANHKLSERYQRWKDHGIW